MCDVYVILKTATFKVALSCILNALLQKCLFLKSVVVVSISGCTIPELNKNKVNLILMVSHYSDILFLCIKSLSECGTAKSIFFFLFFFFVKILKITSEYYLSWVNHLFFSQMWYFLKSTSWQFALLLRKNSVN